MRVKTIDCINNGRSIHDVTHWFVDCCFEALSLAFVCCHLVLEPEVTIFRQEGDAEGESHDARLS